MNKIDRIVWYVSICFNLVCSGVVATLLYLILQGNH